MIRSVSDVTDNKEPAMSKYESLHSKALELAHQLGDGIRHTVPEKAGQLVKASGVALATRQGVKIVRRNPAATVAIAVAAAGAGALLYALSRKKKKEAAGGTTIEGQSRRIEASRTPRPPRKRATKRVAKAAVAESDDS